MLIFEYTIGPEEYLKHQRLIGASAFAKAVRAGRRRTANGLLLLGFSTYAAWEAKLIWLVIPFACIAAFLVFSAAMFSRRFWKEISESLSAVPSRRIRLVVGDDGLHETADSVQSIAPWNAIIGYRFVGGVLFIEISGRLWAMVPERTLVSPSPPLSELVGCLNRHGVSEIAASTI